MDIILTDIVKLSSMKIAEMSARERLIRAGERLFSDQGIDRVRIRDLNTAAEVRNDSAVHYYFGSRDGLLEAILRRHMADVSARVEHCVGLLRVERQPSRAALRDAIAALAIPLGEKLLDERGRRFVQIMAEVYDRRGGLSEAQYAPVSATAMSLIRRSMSGVPGMSAELREERIRLAINFVVSGMGARARTHESDNDSVFDLDTFLVNLVEMGTAACLAPLPDDPEMQQHQATWPRLSGNTTANRSHPG